MQQYPLWKTITLIIATLIGALYALPNLYGEEPAVQITTTSGDPLAQDFNATVGKALSAEKIDPISSGLEGKQWVVRLKLPTRSSRPQMF